MRFKLDENLGTRTRQVFLDAGHDVQTVRDEQLQGRSDEVIYEVCRLERRCLVTLDLDLSNVLLISARPYRWNRRAPTYPQYRHPDTNGSCKTTRSHDG